MVWWFLLGWLIALAVWEIYAIGSPEATVSQALLRVTRRYPWLRLIEVAGMALLTWHLFWGGPF